MSWAVFELGEKTRKFWARFRTNLFLPATGVRLWNLLTNIDACVGWFEGRQESSWNQNPLRFTKKQYSYWEQLESSKSFKRRIIYMILLLLLPRNQRQHICLGWTFSLRHISFIWWEVGVIGLQQSGERAKKQLGRTRTLLLSFFLKRVQVGKLEWEHLYGRCVYTADVSNHTPTLLNRTYSEDWGRCSWNMWYFWIC